MGAVDSKLRSRYQVFRTHLIFEVLEYRGIMHPSLTSRTRQSHSLASHEITVYPLEMLAVFEASGKDTLTFLQGQLTNDIVAPGIEQSRLAGYCTAQGRLLATMVLGEVPTADGIPVVRGLIRQDIVTPVLKRLSMFVLRAKVSLSVVAQQVVGVSASESGYEALIETLKHALPVTPWQTLHTETGTWIAAPSADASRRRFWWIAGEQQQVACEAVAPCWGYGLAPEWESLDIQAGLPWVEARTQDLFIPQTLNLDLIGGVSFTKGCYPGQEIVARSHYRGTVKKRMAQGKVHDSGEASLIPGADVFDGVHPEQPCGRLINVASVSQDHHLEHWVLFETSFGAYDHQQLRALEGNGPEIETVALPYSTRPEAKLPD